MAKKRGKSKAKRISRKQAKKAAAAKPKEQEAKDIPKVSLKDALRDLEILSEEKKVERKVEEVEKKEEKIEAEEKKLEKETKKVEEIEKKIEKEVTPQPLSGFSAKDLNRGIIGAFIGVVAHFGFIYGKAIAGTITMTRATLLLVFSYLLIILLMYETGYRNIKEKRMFGILPKRATLIYLTSLVVVIVIFILFGLIDISKPDFVELYKAVGVTSVLASLGAGTADLLGRH